MSLLIIMMGTGAMRIDICNILYSYPCVFHCKFHSFRRTLGPLLVPMMISNMASGNVSIQLGLKGKNINVVYFPLLYAIPKFIHA